MDSGRDLRLALRALRRAPGYTVAAVLTLSLAIAATAAVFAAGYAVLRPSGLIFEPSRLIAAWHSDPARPNGVIELTYRQVLDWGTAPAITQIAAFGSSAWPMIADGADDPVRWTATAVSSSFFET